MWCWYRRFIIAFSLHTSENYSMGKSKPKQQSFSPQFQNSELKDVKMFIELTGTAYQVIILCKFITMSNTSHITYSLICYWFENVAECGFKVYQSVITYYTFHLVLYLCTRFSNNLCQSYLIENLTKAVISKPKTPLNKHSDQNYISKT